MKNFADFKRKLAETLANNKTVNVDGKWDTTFVEGKHPGFAVYPNGVKSEHQNETRKIGRVASTQFTTLRNSDNVEIWMQFGKASEWTLTENSAVWTDRYDSPHGDHSHVSKITYTF